MDLENFFAIGSRIAFACAYFFWALKDFANSNAFRLPSGFLAQRWAVELEATTPIQQAAIATSTTELTTV